MSDALDDQVVDVGYDDDYGAVLTHDWVHQVVRDHHPHDASWIYFSETAHPKAPALLLLHGVGNSGGIWAPILPELAERSPVLAPTLSPELLVVDAPTPEVAVEPLVEFLAEVTPPPWRLVGHSMGGIISGLLLRGRPDLVAGALLINSPLPGVTRRIRDGDTLDRTGRALLMLKTLSRTTAFGRPRLPRILRGPELLIVRTALRGFVADPGALDDRVISRAIMSTRTRDGSDFLRLARKIPEWATEAFSERLVHIVMGDSDPLVPAADFPEVEERYPVAKLMVLDGCAHFAHLERPTDVVAAVDAFTAALSA